MNPTDMLPLYCPSCKHPLDAGDGGTGVDVGITHPRRRCHRILVRSLRYPTAAAGQIRRVAELLEKTTAMTRFRDLPGGIDRTNYRWPIVSVIHPEHGVFEMSVHCVHCPDDGAMCLVAFGGPLGHTTPNSPERRRQVDMVADMARGTGQVIAPIDEDDISNDIALRLAAQFHADPGAGVIIMPVERP